MPVFSVAFFVRPLYFSFKLGSSILQSVDFPDQMRFASALLLVFKYSSSVSKSIVSVFPFPCV